MEPSSVLLWVDGGSGLSLLWLATCTVILHSIEHLGHWEPKDTLGIADDPVAFDIYPTRQVVVMGRWHIFPKL